MLGLAARHSGPVRGAPRPPAPRTRGMVSGLESSARGGLADVARQEQEQARGPQRRCWALPGGEGGAGPSGRGCRWGGDAAEPRPPCLGAGQRFGSEVTDSPVGRQRSWEARMLASS